MDRKKDIKAHKVQFVLALAVTALLAVVLCSLAWLNYSRSLVTAASVNMPTLWLRGGEGEDTASIELGNIDVEGTAKSKQCIFSVVSTTDTPYILQLAFTTNIPLTYTISRASCSKTGEGIAYNGNYYECKRTLLHTGSNVPIDKLLENTQAATYSTYTNVQSDANPQYWQSGKVEVKPSSEDELTYESGRLYIHYYVLEVSWDSAANNPQNNKETDMIYLSVGTVQQ